MYDLGDVVSYQLSVRDSTGTLADATTVTCTITLPDNSTTTPTVSHPSTGLYTIAYTTSQSGRHLMRWVATGTNASTQSDVFQVAAADPGLIISLAEARATLGLPAANTVNDEDLRGIIAAATGPMEDLCGAIVPRVYDEWYDGGADIIALNHAPVSAVTTVSESWGSYVVALTNQDLGLGSFDSYGYTVDLRTGILTRRVAGTGSRFAVGRLNVHVVYTAGRAVLPANIHRATRRLVRWLYQTEMQGMNQRGSQPESVGYTPAGFAVPNAVKELVAAERRIPGIG